MLGYQFAPEAMLRGKLGASEYPMAKHGQSMGFAASNRLQWLQASFTLVMQHVWVA